MIIINIVEILSLMVAGYCLRILTEGLVPDIKQAWQKTRQDREDDEVLRIVSGLSGDPEPKVDVASEKIKPTLRERLEDWWTQVWADSTPRTHQQIAGFVSYASMEDKLPIRWIFGQFFSSRQDKRKPSRGSVLYTGRHRADKTLKQEGEDGLPISEEEIPRRDRGEAGPGEGSPDERIIDEG